MLASRCFLYVLCIAGAVSVATMAHGQDYPNKPIRMITTAAGGGGDLTTRIISQGIAGPLGQQIIVDNRPIGGADIVAKAPPDGYTLMHLGSAVWTVPFMRKASYDIVRDFAPIAMTMVAPNILVVRLTLPAKSVKELITLAKSKPGELNYGSSGIGSATHLSGEIFKALAGVDIVRVNYRGVADTLNDLMGNRIDMMFVSASSVVPHIKSGKLRALAVTTSQPSLLFPTLPTLAASGVPGYESVLQTAMFAPAKTPSPIIRRLNQEIVRLLRRTDIQEKLFTMGLEPVGDSPDEFSEKLKADLKKLEKIFKEAGIREE